MPNSIVCTIYKLLCFGFLLIVTPKIFAQLTINVTTVPSNTPMADDIYLTGNFNTWNPGDSDFILTNNGDGSYVITFNPNPGLLEYKFTRGDWPMVEGNENGGFLPNRQYNYNGNPSSLDLQILSWEDLGGSGGNSTAAENVMILDDNFLIPQLNRNRRIWIYLPPDYDSSVKNYPVLYMHDGQNLFDAFTSFSGEWEVDESLNLLFDLGDQGAIIVGIENGGVHRIDEYSPWENPQYGGGEGAQYVDFIINTLKPFIDQNFRTRPGRDYTGILGSSMGGLISMYAAIEHQEVFSKAGIFSPSFWFSNQVFSHVSTTGKEADMRIYLLAGEQEGAGVVEDLQQMYNTLLSSGFSSDEVQFVTHPDGQHSEWYWAREFPDAYEWLCSDVTTGATNHTTKIVVDVFPNPVNELLSIHLKEPINNLYFQLTTINGKTLLQKSLINHYQYIDVSYLPDSLYILNILQNGKVIQSEKVLVK